MYTGDSFFTLSVAGQVGLALLSACMFALLIWAMCRLRLIWSMRIVIALAAFWLFVLLSPQVYYLYYMIIIDGLPLQWVIPELPTAGHLLRLLSFSADSTLSAHSQGLLGWSMIAATAIRRKG